MPSIAVLPQKFVTGVSSPEDDWRLPQDGKQRCVVASAEVLELETALLRTWTEDAHCVAYLVLEGGHPLPRQPRVNKGGLDFMFGQGFEVVTTCLIADIDNPDHSAWDSDEHAREGVAHLRELVPTAGAYATKHGARIVQPLSRPVPVTEADPIALAWLTSLLELGINPDFACKDWTRLFRMPHVLRDGRPYRSPCVSLDGMRGIEPPDPIFLDTKTTKKKARKQPPPRLLGPTGETFETPLVKAFEAAGWADRTLPDKKVVVYCPWESGHSTGTRFDTSTVIFGAKEAQPLGWWHCLHKSCMGRTQDDVIAALPPHARKLLEPKQKEVPSETLEKTTEALTDAIRNAPDGVSLIAAQCGLGKTHAARTVAIERAAKVHENGSSKRAPLNSKTAISLPTTKLVEEQVVAFAKEDIAVKQIRGVLSVLDGNGKPVCKWQESARYLARGGQSIPWELCEGRGKTRCEYADDCTAYGGVTGPKDARIIVGPHQLINQLSNEAGSTGLLVVDEPPPLVESHTLSLSDLDAAWSQLTYFEERFSEALRPALDAIITWLKEGGDDETGHLSRALEIIEWDLSSATEATGKNDAFSCAKAAFKDDHKGRKVPPLKDWVANRCTWDTGLAQLIGIASRALGLIYRALAYDQVVARVEDRRDQKVIAITAPNEDFEKTLFREGSTVITDAGAELIQPTLAKVLRHEPPLHVFTAPDGAPIERAMLRTKGTRTKWMPRGQLKIEGSLVEAVARMVEWVKSDPMTRKVGIVTIRTVRFALEAACGIDVTDDWRKAGQSLATLDKARELLSPILAELPERPDFGHYGAIRGLDHWKGHDAVITIGDPWMNKSDVKHECDFLGIEAWNERYKELCRADLEQAQGRLRTVHRTKPGRALHIGGVIPGRWPLDFHVEELIEGRPQNRGRLPDDMGELVNAAGGVAGLARELGRGERTIHRYIAGERGVSPEVLRDLDALRERFAGAGLVPGLPKSLREGIVSKAFGQVFEGGSDDSSIELSGSPSPEPAEPVRQLGPSSTPALMPSPAELEKLVQRFGSIRALAQATDIPYPSLRRYLNGEREARPDVVLKLRRMVAPPAPEKLPLAHHSNQLTRKAV